MTNKTKNILLLLGFFLTLVLCYRLAISNTLALKKQYNSLKQEEALFNNTPKQLSLLKQKQRHYDSILTKYQFNGSSIQNNLLKTINAFAESDDLKVIGFLEPHVINQNDLTHLILIGSAFRNKGIISQQTHLEYVERMLAKGIDMTSQAKRNPLTKEALVVITKAQERLRAIYK